MAISLAKLVVNRHVFVGKSALDSISNGIYIFQEHYFGLPSLIHM